MIPSHIEALEALPATAASQGAKDRMTQPPGSADVFGSIDFRPWLASATPGYGLIGE